MKSIRLICVGKLRFPGVAETAAEYQRIGRFVQLDLIELKAMVADRSERALVIEKEAETILGSILPRAPIWCLDETGTSMRTSEWAQQFQKMEMTTSGQMNLIVGGSLGLAPALKARADRMIAFGPQTLSHELIRVVLLEQLYRALSLNAGHPYHNEG